MERWKVILLVGAFILCWLVVGYYDDPADYHLTTNDPYIEQSYVE
jgi:hypothetical protein